jgi:transcriptional regulator with XRE-family HTH domain
MADRVVSSALSGDVIDLLVARGMTLTQIAHATGTTKSFISRVKSRSRSLTIDHMVALEEAVGEPLPLLLLKATPLATLRPALRPLYKATLKAVSGGRAPTASRKRAARAA